MTIPTLAAAPPATLDIPVVRAVSHRVETRQGDDEGMPTMEGHMSVFDVWYEIDSFFEGRFLERTAPGSFAKTFREQADDIKVTFNHGHDPHLGDKVLGVPDTLDEDSVGARYEVPLLDTSYNRDLLPGLEAGAYGSSFRFRVIKDEWNDEPGASDHNPNGIPERTIKEVRVFEFGPVTFPANPDATAGVRSLTDEFYESVRTRNPREYEDMVARAIEIRTPAAEGTGAAETTDEPPESTRRSDEDIRMALAVWKTKMQEATA